MTTLAHTWKQPVPRRGALSTVDVADDAVWEDRLRADRQRAARNQPAALAAITAEVEARARALGARALVLSGSTARARRTSVSDLDYHVIGARPDVHDLPEDIDLYSDSAEKLAAKLRSGDDFVHWSVWYGCILFDHGELRKAARFIAARDAWPDAERKRMQARETLRFAESILRTGDYDAALEQVRGTLSLTARWVLLTHEIFPLARDELPEQLATVGESRLARALAATIHEQPPERDLAAAIGHARTVLAESHG